MVTLLLVSISEACCISNSHYAGNTKGEVILFEPSTQEHISARTIFDPITALAPASDCKTYAIGYNNGSILLAALQPAFTILHTLSTSRGPSPIANLAWHASSSKQKSDMLAIQTSDGDLRVWSVAKPATTEAPRVIRVLRRAESSTGPNWMAWSKTGRIVQYSEKETYSWDVRTKHVTYEQVPTVNNIKAITNYGPTATLFTLGANHTIQQYDLDHQQMVANVQHFPSNAVPPTPPEDNKQLGFSTSESEEEAASPIRRARYEMSALEAARIDRTRSISPGSMQSRTDSVSSRTSSNQGKQGRFLEAPSPAQRTDRSGTTFSMGTQSLMSKDPMLTGSSLAYPSATSSPASTRSTRRGSRLKQEILPSPEDKPIPELFPYIRARLSDVPYKPIRPFDESRLTPDDLRRQMLNVVFGWEEDIQDLIRDELRRHPMGSQNAVLLSKWLNDDSEHMAAMIGAGGTPSNLGWMMLALSGTGSGPQSKKVGQAFVEKMLARGDIHAAATLLLSLGDQSDAIEVYVTRNNFMEAILLTCLLKPTDWQQQSFLVRRWGEHVVENSQQHLAIRCFSCTGVEPSEAWTSPTAQKAAMGFPDIASVTQEPYAPSIAATISSAAPSTVKALPRRNFLEAPTPVAMPAPPNPLTSAMPPAPRMTAKNSALKLITSFGPPSQVNYRFPGLKSDDRTPTNAPGVTPIAESAVGESALTPGGLGSYRLNSARAIGSALGGRTATPGGFRRRLPSIGETPVDTHSPAFPVFSTQKPLPTPIDSGSDKEKEAAIRLATAQQAGKPTEQPPMLLLSSARYEPTKTPMKDTPLTAVAPTTTIKFQPSEGTIGEASGRNGSRGRKPEGLSLHMVPVEEVTTDESSLDPVRYAESFQRSDTAESYSTTQIDTHSEMTSPPTTGNSYKSLKSPSVSGRSIDQYISSLEQAQYYGTQKHSSRDRKGGDDQYERKRSKNRNAPSEEDRGRKGRRIPASKRSPTSPIPMSPEDLNMYNASVESFGSVYQTKSEASTHRTRDKSNQSRSNKHKNRSESKTEKHRHRSSSRRTEGKSKPSSRRRPSPDPSIESAPRGRKESRDKSSRLRSPSSPIPMSASGEDLRKISDVDQALRLVSHDRQREDRHREKRSKSRRAERGTSARRDPSPDRRRHRTRSTSRQAADRTTLSRKNSVNGRVEADSYKASQEAPEDRLYSALYNETTTSSKPSAVDRKRKEIAAAELEARRLSLARRPSVPAIPLPGHLTAHGKSLSSGTPPLQRAHTDTMPTSFAGRLLALEPSAAPAESDSGSSGKDSSKLRSNLPGTPRAMRHQDFSSMAEPVPEIPDNLMTLPGIAYRPDPYLEIQRSMSAPVPQIPADMPMHPAFDWRVPNSRSSSKGRERTFSPDRRAVSRERPLTPAPEVQVMNIGSSPETSTTAAKPIPPILPELQHLAAPPPPPPPPPAPPAMMPHHSAVTGLAQAPTQIEAGPKTAPLAHTGFPPDTSASASPNHRRGRSGNEFVDKIKSFTGRLRSTSRGRNTASPQSENPSPYESLPGIPTMTTQA